MKEGIAFMSDVQINRCFCDSPGPLSSVPKTSVFSALF